MKQFSLLSLFLFFSITSLFAQTEDAVVDSAAVKPKKEKKYKVKKQVKAANKMLTKGNIYAASDLYEEIMTHAPDDVVTAYKLAESYRIARDYKKAEDWYFKVTEMDPVDFSHAYYWYALMLKMNAKYEAARAEFDDFQKRYKGDDEKLKKWAKIESDGCKLALKLKEDPLPVNVMHLNDKVNSAYSDIAPLMWNDTTLLFASLPTDTVIVISGNATANDHHIKFYKSTVKERNEYEEAQVFEKFNAAGFHTANGAFSPDKKRFYFTQCADAKNGRINCAIFVSQYKDTAWTEPESVSDEINDVEFTSTHPFITPGKKGYETLYFVSNREEGKGGLDIWTSNYNIKKNTYSEPKNAGSKINTDRDEVTPFVDAATSTFYFSSDGHVNVGGYDVYKAEGTSGKWNEPVNIGFPINSSADDMYFKVAEDGKAGFFVSNRPGIISIRSETCCDDIFKFEYFKVRNIAVQGFVYEEDGISKDPIEKSTVGLALESAEGIAQNIQIGEDTILNGKPYFFPLNYEKEYRVTGSAEGFLSNSVAFNTKGIEGSDTLWVDIYLKRFILDKVYRLRNIYYDFDKWDLRDLSKKQLDTLYNLMIENPTIIVEIGSHTDIRATEQYNINLSQRRAESCVNYLISRGIQKERLQAKGYGESRLLDDCTQYPECPTDNSSDCPCHQNNRRTEFKVVGQLDADLIYDDKRFGDEESTEDDVEKKKEKEK